MTYFIYTTNQAKGEKPYVAVDAASVNTNVGGGLGYLRFQDAGGETVAYFSAGSWRYYSTIPPTGSAPWPPLEPAP